MSIYVLRQMMASVPDGKNVTMRYEDGGATQVFALGSVEVRLPATAALEEIRQALLDELAKQA